MTKTTANNNQVAVAVAVETDYRGNPLRYRCTSPTGALGARYHRITKANYDELVAAGAITVIGPKENKRQADAASVDYALRLF